jgi:polysaccharide deacetylase family protein (PEP-CTERM system associated)
MLNTLTIDLEDYYHVSAFESVIRFAEWERYESRVERNSQVLLDLLDAYGTRATFFVLGWVAERQPALIQTIARRGHEIAAHGYRHRRVYTQTLAEFQAETYRVKSVLEDILGQPIFGYRAASYSITAQSLWALDVLREAGFVYDSSIFPVRHDLYGIPGYQRFCHVRRHGAGNGLIEVPLSTLRLGQVTIPFAGGGYFRLFPYAFTRWGIRHLNCHEGQAAVVYLHPWEIDPDQPRIQAGRLSRFRHYVNLRRTAPRLQRLLQDFRFSTMLNLLQQYGLLSQDFCA